MKQFKIRASAGGKITSRPRSKKAKDAGELSLTSKSYVQQVVKEQTFGRRKEFSNKYTVKGLSEEDAGIALLNKIFGTKYKKNEESFEDDFFTGTPDIIGDKVIDIKCSWDLWTFPMFDEEIKNKDYWWQLQVYMHLTGKRKAQLAYCLIDTPEELIQKEFNSKKWETPEDQHEELLDQIIKNMSFEDIPEKLRIKTFDIDYDTEAIAEIKERVEECREYQAELLGFIS